MLQLGTPHTLLLWEDCQTEIYFPIIIIIQGTIKDAKQVLYQLIYCKS